MHIDISIPVSVLEEVNIQVGKPVGHVRVHAEDDWVVVNVLASTIKFRPLVEPGNIVLQEIQVSGMLWPARSKIEKTLEEGTQKITLPNVSMSIKDKKIQISLDVG